LNAEQQETYIEQGKASVRVSRKENVAKAKSSL